MSSNYTKRQLENFKKDAMTCMMDAKWLAANPKHVQNVMEGLYEMSNAAIEAMDKMEQTAEWMQKRVSDQLRDMLAQGRTMNSSCGVLNTSSAEFDIAASKAETAMMAVRMILKMVPELDKKG